MSAHVSLRESATNISRFIVRAGNYPPAGLRGVGLLQAQQPHPTPLTHALRRRVETARDHDEGHEVGSHERREEEEKAREVALRGARGWCQSRTK